MVGSIVLRCHSYDDNKVLVTPLPQNSRLMHRTYDELHTLIFLPHFAEFHLGLHCLLGILLGVIYIQNL